MTAAPHSNRDAKADAKARQWAQKARKDGEAGKLGDDTAFMARQIAKEKQKLSRK